MLGHHLVFALPFAELHERYLVATKPSNSATSSCGRQELAAVPPEELHNPALGLQSGHIDVEVHLVDPLDRKLHMMAEDIGHALCYHACGSGRTVLPLVGV
jgi:hypothetical protein